MDAPTDRLIWIDLEMTGLDPDTDRIIELAMIVTDNELNTIAESPVLVVHQADDVLAGMDEWNTRQHGQSGLTDRVRASTLNESEVEREALAFLQPLVAPRTSPMCGNSICQDRRFLYRYMRSLEDFFHYRNLDVSTLKELVSRWVPEQAAPDKVSSHLALDDIRDSVAELRHYRGQIFGL